MYLWCIPLWRGMRALMEGRLDDWRQLDEEVQTNRKISNSDNPALLVQFLRLCMLLEASPTEEALVLVSASPSSEVSGRMAVDDETARRNPADNRGDKRAPGRRLRRHPRRRPMVGAA